MPREALIGPLAKDVLAGLFFLLKTAIGARVEMLYSASVFRMDMKIYTLIILRSRL